MRISDSSPSFHVSFTLRRVTAQKKGEYHLKTIRPVNIQLVPGTETSPIKLVDAVLPINETGHPQLTCALREQVMTCYEGCGNLYRYVQAALLRLKYTALEKL